MSDKRNPRCVHAAIWTKARLGKGSLGPLTGQDSRAFAAFAHLLDLYLTSDDEGRRAALDAMRAVLRAVQPHCREILKASIPAIGDWSHEGEIWRRVRPKAEAAE